MIDLFKMKELAGDSGDDALDFVRLSTVMMRQNPAIVREVKVEPIKKALARRLDGKIFLKACFHNTWEAMKIVLKDYPSLDVWYVLGYWDSIIPVEHCFLKYDNKYYDPTALLFDDKEGIRYFSLYELTYGEVVKTQRFIKKQYGINNHVSMYEWIRRASSHG